tara:strand:- start:1287 stop:2288 length:1002 start_codon:yes stop_codon:yes gene_type:complete
MSNFFSPVLGISTGDPNGIGIEVILKSLDKINFIGKFIPVIFSNYKLIEEQKRIFNVNCEIVPINNIENLSRNSVNVFNINNKDFDIEFGKSNSDGGDISRLSLRLAVEFLKNSKIDGLVTGPINKNNIQNNDFNFKGHTDFLDSCFNGQALMFMVSSEIKIALLTEHIPIDKVVGEITTELIKSRIKLVEMSLKNDFNINKPKIAVLSINPHVGDGGVIGKHDDIILSPTIQEVSESGIDISGPFASDSFFGTNIYKSFDAIIASYHDQGLIPFKTLTFGNGVNFTAGLDIVRTSPDHGTAYDIAGKNIANPSSFSSAILEALNIIKNRKKN